MSNNTTKYYVHYGHDKFDKEKFQDISNTPFANKPRGGLWASPVKAPFSWKDWNETEDFVKCDDNNCFTFKLERNAKIYEIHSVDDFLKMAKAYPGGMGRLGDMVDINFEEMANDYDGIELFLSEDRQLYWSMYGWDCDSIIILKPDVVVEVDKEIALNGGEGNIGDNQYGVGDGINEDEECL